MDLKYRNTHLEKKKKKKENFQTQNLLQYSSTLADWTSKEDKASPKSGKKIETNVIHQL